MKTKGVLLLGVLASLIAATQMTKADSVAAPSPKTFVIGTNDFLLDGKKFQIRCGEIHAARVPKEYWRQRLQMAGGSAVMRVDSFEGQLKWKRRLTDLGIPVSGPMPRGYFTSLYFQDPDGQVLEIATKGPGYQYDEPIEALGQKLMLPKPSQLPGGRDEMRIHLETHPEPVPAITHDMQLTGIHHVTGMTDDIARANEFYHAALGLNVVKQSVNQDDPDTPHWFWANYDGTRVLPHSSWTLFGWTPRHLRARPGVGQTSAVAFRAKNAEEQLAWRDHLKSMGVDVSPVVDQKYFTTIRFSAPDGQPLEIATDGPGFQAR